MSPRTIVAVAAGLVVGLGAVACGDGDGGSASAPLRILVTNDDGVDNEGDNTGIDALVEALRSLRDTEVVVVVPAEDRSGTGGQTSPGPLEAEESATAGGFPATEVDGFPADAVTWALDGGIDVTPDLVVSGINPGQNIGVLSEISGTVGAARAAAAAGIPSLAVSVGFDVSDYSFAVELALDWIDEHRDDLVAGEVPAETVSINVPGCDEVRDLVEVPTNPTSEMDHVEVDCGSALTEPGDDVEAFVNGFAVISVVGPAPD